jgi:acetyltransferase-like isoleucine patch superfamily enzyme
MDISVGKDTYGDNARIFGLGYEGHSTLKIGERTHIAKNVTLMISSGHELGNPSKHIVHYGDKLEIGNDVWIGYGATILPGCRKIGNNSVIGACAVVTHDVVPYTVVGGNPAKVIKKISKFK